MDFAEQVKWLVDEAYPDAGTMRVVLDNLNIRKPGSLYEAYEPSEARRIARRLEFHHTPKHGSRLNMAEIELSVFSKQALRGRIGDEETLRRQIGVLERERNEAGATIDWLFSVKGVVVQGICPLKCPAKMSSRNVPYYQTKVPFTPCVRVT